MEQVSMTTWQFTWWWLLMATWWDFRVTQEVHPKVFPEIIPRREGYAGMWAEPSHELENEGKASAIHLSLLPDCEWTWPAASSVLLPWLRLHDRLCPETLNQHPHLPEVAFVKCFSRCDERGDECGSLVSLLASVCPSFVVDESYVHGVHWKTCQSMSPLSPNP